MKRLAILCVLVVACGCDKTTAPAVRTWHVVAATQSELNNVEFCVIARQKTPLPMLPPREPSCGPPAKHLPPSRDGWDTAGFAELSKLPVGQSARFQDGHWKPITELEAIEGRMEFQQEKLTELREEVRKLREEVERLKKQLRPC